MTNSLTADIEAINMMLSVIGEAPINTVVGATSDANIAQIILREVSREVQSRGWLCNTEYDVPLSRDSENKIPLPTNVLRLSIDPVNLSASRTPVQRGNWLYDVQNRTFEFTGDVKARIVYFLDFTDLPEPIRRYITIKAARVFQDRMMGAETTHAYTAVDEAQAFQIAISSEAVTRGASMLDNPEIAYWSRRSI